MRPTIGSPLHLLPRPEALYGGERLMFGGWTLMLWINAKDRKMEFMNLEVGLCTGLPFRSHGAQ